MTRAYDIVGGPLDGQQRKLTVESRLQGGTILPWFTEDEQSYVMTQFRPDPMCKKTEVVIFVWCGLAPIKAMQIWRERSPQ